MSLARSSSTKKASIVDMLIQSKALKVEANPYGVKSPRLGKGSTKDSKVRTTKYVKKVGKAER